MPFWLDQPVLYGLTTMIAEVYDAFRSAGVPEDKARAAAAALSEQDHATRIDISRLRWQLLIIKWLFAVVIVLVLFWLTKPFFA